MQSIYEVKETDPDQSVLTTKKCPFCAELIQYEAIKCRYCNEFLDGSPRPTSAPPTSTGKKMLQSTPAVIIALLTAGPLALPLVWANPRYNKTVKTVISVVTLAVTVGLCVAVYKVSVSSLNQIKSLGLM